MTGAHFFVRIWGAQGSLPGPAAVRCAFGTETPCVEVRCGDRVLVFDVGSGVEGLNAQLKADGVKDFDIFFSHCHFDHIMGLPFLRPLYQADAVVRMHAGHLGEKVSCRDMVYDFMTPPYFPITPDFFYAKVDYRDFCPPNVITPHEGITVSTLRLNHPNGCVGYRVDYSGKAFCYITDTEHTPGRPDQAVLNAIRGADIMIYDCTYTDAEFDYYVGYGHSTWEEGVRLCKAAGVKQLVIFHHGLGRTDEDLERIEKEAKARFPGAVVGRSGLTLVP